MTSKKPKKDFEAWKHEAQRHAITVSCPDDLWAEDDPYDLKDLALESFNKNESPSDFIEEIFQEDIASNTPQDGESFFDSAGIDLE